MLAFLLAPRSPSHVRLLLLTSKSRSIQRKFSLRKSEQFRHPLRPLSTTHRLKVEADEDYRFLDSSMGVTRFLLVGGLSATDGELVTNLPRIAWSTVPSAIGTWDLVGSSSSIETCDAYPQIVTRCCLSSIDSFESKSRMPPRRQQYKRDSFPSIFKHPWPFYPRIPSDDSEQARCSSDLIKILPPTHLQAARFLIIQFRPSALQICS